MCISIFYELLLNNVLISLAEIRYIEKTDWFNPLICEPIRLTVDTAQWKCVKSIKFKSISLQRFAINIELNKTFTLNIVQNEIISSDGL